MIALNPTVTRAVVIDGFTYTVVEDLSNERISFLTANGIAVGYAQPCIMSCEIDIFLTDEFGTVLSKGKDELPEVNVNSEEIDAQLLLRILALKTIPETPFESTNIRTP